jgi:hypothetical protein
MHDANGDAHYLTKRSSCYSSEQTSVPLSDEMSLQKLGISIMTAGDSHELAANATFPDIS